MVASFDVAAGLTDRHIAAERSVLFEFSRFLGQPLWTAVAGDADRYLARLRRERALAHSTVAGKAGTLAMFYDFLINRYQGDIHALTGYVVVQLIDEFNRPERDRLSVARIPPSQSAVAALFDGWRDALTSERKFLSTARDYFAASLWRRLGLRISETCRLDLRDWHPALGDHGKLHVRFGKGSNGRGYKARVVPAIDGVDELMAWWLTYVRHQFDDRWQDPDAPLLPSERRDRETGRCTRVGPDALRSGLAAAVDRYLASWSGRCTPHTLRHYCASTLYARDRPQSDSGVARTHLALDNNLVYPCSQGSCGAGLGSGQRAHRGPTRRDGRVSRCAGSGNQGDPRSVASELHVFIGARNGNQVTQLGACAGKALEERRWSAFRSP